MSVDIEEMRKNQGSYWLDNQMVLNIIDERDALKAERDSLIRQVSNYDDNRLKLEAEISKLKAEVERLRSVAMQEKNRSHQSSENSGLYIRALMHIRDLAPTKEEAVKLAAEVLEKTRGSLSLDKMRVDWQSRAAKYREACQESLEQFQFYDKHFTIKNHDKELMDKLKEALKEAEA